MLGGVDIRPTLLMSGLDTKSLGAIWMEIDEDRKGKVRIIDMHQCVPLAVCIFMHAPLSRLFSHEFQYESLHNRWRTHNMCRLIESSCTWYWRWFQTSSRASRWAWKTSTSTLCRHPFCKASPRPRMSPVLLTYTFATTTKIHMLYMLTDTASTPLSLKYYLMCLHVECLHPCQRPCRHRCQSRQQQRQWSRQETSAVASRFNNIIYFDIVKYMRQQQQ